MSNLSSIVKSIQDIMRQDSGVDGDAQRIGQLTWLFFLKIFDAYELQQETLHDHYRSPLPEHLRWRDWAADPEGRTGEALLDFINIQLFPTLKELPGDLKRNPRAYVIHTAFEDTFNYMKSGQLLRQVINKINGIDFNRQADRHQFNDIYEKILRDLQSAGNAGEFYTPRAVTQFMVDMVNPQLGETVLDPACGTGGFLVCALEHLRKQARSAEDAATLQTSIHGVERKQLPHLLCVTNMLLHGIDVPSGIRHDNTLTYMDQAVTDFVPIDIAEKCWARCKPEMLDVLMVSVGATLGRLSILRDRVDMVLVRSVTVLRPIQSVVSSDCLAWHLRSPSTQSEIWRSGKQSAQPCLYLAKSNALLIALPPLAEQHRIVARVEQLRHLCANLRKRLQQARATQSQLADSLVSAAAQSLSC